MLTDLEPDFVFPTHLVLYTKKKNNKLIVTITYRVDTCKKLLKYIRPQHKKVLYMFKHVVTFYYHTKLSHFYERKTNYH